MRQFPQHLPMLDLRFLKYHRHRVDRAARDLPLAQPGKPVGEIPCLETGGNQRMPDKGSLNAFVDFRNGKESGGSSVNYNNTVRENELVRRLTPLECERLQGLPDGWTDIGDWTDDKGKKHKTTDSNRYKALGNSIALPFWKYLLKRISAEYERDATMASLFDGIGSFPLMWEQINGKGSCKWISEIEPFCCALTEKRFS